MNTNLVDIAWCVLTWIVTNTYFWFWKRSGLIKHSSMIKSDLDFYCCRKTDAQAEIRQQA
jgi:hypothetical protein